MEDLAVVLNVWLLFNNISSWQKPYYWFTISLNYLYSYQYAHWSDCTNSVDWKMSEVGVILFVRCWSTLWSHNVMLKGHAGATDWRLWQLQEDFWKQNKYYEFGITFLFLLWNLRSSLWGSWGGVAHLSEYVSMVFVSTGYRIQTATWLLRIKYYHLIYDYITLLNVKRHFVYIFGFIFLFWGSTENFF